MRIALIAPQITKNTHLIPFSTFVAPPQRIERYWKKQGHVVVRFDPATKEGGEYSALDFAEFAKVQDLDFALGFGPRALECFSCSSLYLALFLERDAIYQLLDDATSRSSIGNLRRARALITDDPQAFDALIQSVPLVKRQMRYIKRSFALPPSSFTDRPQDLGLPASASWFVVVLDKESTRVDALYELMEHWHRQNPHLFLLTIDQNELDLSSRSAAKSTRRLGVFPVGDDLSTAAFSFAAKRALAVIDLTVSPGKSHFTLQALGMGALLAIPSWAKAQTPALFTRFNSLCFEDDHELVQLCDKLRTGAEPFSPLRSAAQKFAYQHHHFARESFEYAQILKEVTKA